MKKLLNIALITIAIGTVGVVKAQAPENRALIVLNAQKEDIENDITFIKKEIDAINYGWFGFGLSKETKEKYRAAKASRKNLEKELTKIESKITILKTNKEKGEYV